MNGSNSVVLLDFSGRFGIYNINGLAKKIATLAFVTNWFLILGMQIFRVQHTKNLQYYFQHLFVKKIFGNYSLDRTIDRRRKETQNCLQLLFGFVLPAQVIRCLFHVHLVVSTKRILWHHPQVAMETRDLRWRTVCCVSSSLSPRSSRHGSVVVSFSMAWLW